MSETMPKISEEAEGAAGIEDVLLILAEHRAAVALALLGGLSDDLIERCRQALVFAGIYEGQLSSRFDETAAVRAVLREAFGLKEPTE